MIVSQGYWKDLPVQCKRCTNIQIMSAHMDGNHYYLCSKYPLEDSDELCPEYMDGDFLACANMITELAAVDYGKERFFRQKDGTWYDRDGCDYISLEEMLTRAYESIAKNIDP